MKNPDNDPTKGVDEWSLPGLSLADRKKIKSQLLKAQAIFHRTSWNDSLRLLRPVQQAFSGIASILFDAKLLTTELLENQLRLLISESAIAGGSLYFATDVPRVEIFPKYFGNPFAKGRLP
ncbi:MAG: hypothetical protein ACLQVM_17570 [Terriglobia bacterium]